MPIRCYSSGWKQLIRDTVTSYADVYNRIQRSRDYHEERSSLSFEDRENRDMQFSVEIPLLWGTF